MSQKKTSVKVPKDLLDAVRDFHNTREKVNGELMAVNAEYQRMQQRMVSEQNRLDGVFRTATIAVTEALVNANLVPKDTVFFLNTEFLEDHGEAYIVTHPEPSDVCKDARTVH